MGIRKHILLIVFRGYTTTSTLSDSKGLFTARENTAMPFKHLKVQVS